MALRFSLLLWMGFICDLLSAQSVNQVKRDVTFNMTLQNIPSDLPLNITKLNLSHNAIKLSEKDIQTLKKYSQLREIHLDNSNLTILPGHMFDSFSQLTILNLSYNNITRVEPRAFSGLANVRELDLSHNSIASLPTRVFTNLSNLEALQLQGNRLHVLENSTLWDLKQANHLNLDDNPWNCTSTFLWAMNCLRGTREKTGSAVCTNPADLAGKSILNNSTQCLPEFSSTSPHKETPSVPTTISSQRTANSVSNELILNGNPTDSEKDSIDAPLPERNNWKFLVGVVAVVLGVSLLMMCVVMTPKCYRRLCYYHHRQLREEDSDLFTTRCHVNFSLDSEEVETNTQELDISLDNEDGYIEDGYIENRNYRLQTEN